MSRNSRWKYLYQVGGALTLLLLLAVGAFFLYPLWGFPLNSQRHGNPPLTPAWALGYWVWEDDTNTAESTLEMVNGHLRHDFPVQTVLIDSPWSTRYNDFKVDETRFPNAEAFFKSLDERDIRVVLWMTSMVNSENKDTALTDAKPWFEEAAQNGYLLGGGFEKKWWKGRGGFIDYTNPEALAWWQGMQAQVLDWGVDGWKLDGSATLAFANKGPLPWFYLDAHSGPLSTRAYMDLYYREELAGGQAKNPEFATLSRALDSVGPRIHPEGFAPIDASPINWLGDNTHTWEEEGGEEPRGLERAIRLTLESADLGYNIIGTDVAGYHGDEPIDPELYIRWAQFSAFSGLFLNGGHGERRMWMRTPEELEIIRTYAWLHTELIPYMYHYVVTAHEGGRRLVKPMTTGTYQYMFGEDLLVAPIYQPGGRRTVELPEGLWRYWFDDTAVIQGPTTVNQTFAKNEYPVYVREGAILPMRVERDYTGIGNRDWAAYLTLNIYPTAANEFVYYDTDTMAPATIRSETGDPLSIELEDFTIPVILRVLYPKKPSEVARDGVALPDESWEYLPDPQRLLIRAAEAPSGRYTIR